MEHRRHGEYGGRARGSPFRVFAIALAGLAGLVAAGVGPAEARRLASREEALRSCFGESTRVVTRTLYLTTAESRALRRRARAPFDARRVTYYAVFAADTLAGVAFVDRHVVRSLTETLLIALDPDGRVRAVEVLAWNEPDDYRPSERWLERALGRDSIATLRPGHDLPRLAGATLTARAVSAAVRRALALGERALAAERR